MTLLEELQEKVEGFHKIVYVAEKLLKEAQDSKSPQKEFLLGLAAYELLEFETAHTLLSSSFDLEKNSETAARLAVCSWRLKNFEEAQQWIKKAISMDPKGSIKTLVLETKPTYLAIYANILFSSGNIDEAISTAQAALNLDSADVLASSVIASAQLMKGDDEAAIRALDQPAIKSASSFLAPKLQKEIDTAMKLRDANVKVSPFLFVSDLLAIAV